MVDTLPQSFGAYELYERLGAGGMAETFVASRRGPGALEQRVCLKRVLPALESDPMFVKMFLREARVSALLHHPHIARVLDFGKASDTHFLTLELIEGTNLRTLLRFLRRRAEPLDLGLTLHLAHALGRALEFAHTADVDGFTKGVVHRDISPSNVLLSSAGEVKLADFGIAKAMNQPGSVQSQALKGKVPYMAPEYAIGRHCSARSDLFSLGVVLHECLAGFRPFDGGNDLQTLEQARLGYREPLSSVAPHAPAPLTQLVDALLEPDAKNRPPTATVLLDRLDELPPPVLARRHLGQLVQRVRREPLEATIPGLVATRPAATQRPRRRLPSRR
jgi:serine/threonine protein kinase